MKDRAVRRSPFAGASPAAPQTEQRAAQKPSDTQRFTLRLPVELVEKTRTAWLVDGVPRGVRSVSAWVGELLQEEITRIEADHGSLPRTPPGVVPSGWNAHHSSSPAGRSEDRGPT